MTSHVDFDYSGPPVAVSNGMAVQLVSQFGVRNAWFAFLKLRGMKLTNEEAETAQPSFAYFRNKIGHLRRQIDGLDGDDQAEQLGTLTGADFDDFLVSADSVELKGDAPKYADIDEKELLSDNGIPEEAGNSAATPTTASLLEVIEKSKRKTTTKTAQSNGPTSGDGEKQQKAKNSSDGDEAVTPAVAQKEAGDGVANVKATTGRKGREREDDPETKQVVEKLLAAKEEIARRHAETIDDVVSLVMEKIRNNQPFEGELNAGASGVHTGPPKSHHKRAGAGGGQRLARGGGVQRKGEEQMPAGYGHVQQPQQQQFMPPVSGQAMAPPPGMMGQAPAGAYGHLPPGQSIVLLHHPTAGAVQIPPQYSVAPPLGKMQHGHPQPPTMATTGVHPQMQHEQVTILGGGNYAPAGSNMQQQQPRGGQPQQQIIGHLTTTGGEPQNADGSPAIPIELAIQQNMTVQELIQTLKTQSRHQNAQIILHHNAPPPTTMASPSSSSTGRHVHFQPQQETPDSSSQEASLQEAQKLATNVSAAKKGRKRKAADEKGTTMAQTKQQSLEMPAVAMLGKEEAKKEIPQPNLKAAPKEEEGAVPAKKTKQAPKGKKAAAKEGVKEEPQISTPATSSTAKGSEQKKQQQQVDELDAQVRKTNKQLVTERNKSAALKKRAEKLQTELDKALDQIQLLQIDLACQKTDNNNLIAENIALKAENQQLRTKGLSAAQRAAASTSSSSANAVPTSSSSASVPNAGRGRKKKVAMEEQQEPVGKAKRGRKAAKESSRETESPAMFVPEKALTPPPLSSELGRRQSKRICVARSQFMKNLF